MKFKKIKKLLFSLLIIITMLTTSGIAVITSMVSNGSLAATNEAQGDGEPPIW